MATIGQVKDLLKKELEALHSKLETMSTEFSELRTSVQLFSDMYADLLKQIKQYYLFDLSTVPLLHLTLLQLLFLTIFFVSTFFLFPRLYQV